MDGEKHVYFSISLENAVPPPIKKYSACAREMRRLSKTEFARLKQIRDLKARFKAQFLILLHSYTKKSLFGDREENQHLVLHGPPAIWLEEVKEKNI